jgi:AhpD family alkylhydroperoxidase
MIASLDEEMDAILTKGKEKAAEDVIRSAESTYGEVPYIFSFMKDNPDILITRALYNNSILRSSSLDAKTIELISIAVSAALRCSNCLKLHIRSASNLGIPDDQVAAAVFISGNLASASILSTATRELKEGREFCSICEICSEACAIKNE